MKLAARYFVALAGFAATGFVAFAIVEAVPTYRENVERAGELQRLESRMAAAKIDAFLESIETQIRAVDQLPWNTGLLTEQDHREEFHRLMTLNPAVFELRSIGPDGRERLYVSRVALDRIDAGIDASGEAAFGQLREHATWYSPAYFRSGSEPYVSLAMRQDDPSGDIVVAELNLRFVADVVERVRIGHSGSAYIVDASNHLLAHPNLSLVHRNVDLSGLPQVAQAREAFARSPSQATTLRGHSADRGGDVLTSAYYVAAPRWIVFAEQPLDEVMAPVKTTLYRTLGLLLALLLVGVGVSLLIARKLTRPILAIQRGASSISRGNLAARVNVTTGDEVETLANEFNRMAENLGQSYAELESRVQARTRDLSKATADLQTQAQQVEALNARLTQQLGELALRRDEAERANSAKTRFLAAASHDLRQPMHTVSLLVGILRERLHGLANGDLVDKVQSSVRTMESLFNSLLDISKLDAGAIRASVTNFDVAVLLDAIETNYGPQAREKGIELRVVRCRATIATDRAMLERIVGNLVANAIRYTDRGGVLIGCRRRGQRLRLVVVDTGIGIPEEHLDHVFEEFFQLANPGLDHGKGLGLGLSIVKRSAALLDLPLAVVSRVGRGSNFMVDVPRAYDHEVTAALPQYVPGRHTEGAFVVVIDDDDENRFAMATLCAEWGCHIVSASSADEALEELRNHLRQPDLILTDYRLRDRLTGLMAVEAIRRSAEAAIPAVVVTADLSAADTVRAASPEIVLLRKPVNPDELRRALDQLLARQGVVQ